MLLLCLLAQAPTRADEPTEILVIERAHTFMVQRIAFLNNASFGPAVVHPQPGGRYWAVGRRVRERCLDRQHGAP